MALHPSAQKVADAAMGLGLDVTIVEHQQTTRSAQEAADAIGCDVAQIVKSLCFEVHGTPTMALLSGNNRLDTRKLAAVCGAGTSQVRRADAEVVKAATGFTIGGVPPFGHTKPLPIFIDEDLTQFDVVWAAAGTPFAVFAIAPAQLVRASNGRVANLKVE